MSDAQSVLETPLATLDRSSRARWMTAAVGILIENNTLDTLRLMVGGGEATFIHIAKQFWGVHEFHHSEYVWAFKQIRKAVTQADADARAQHVIHG